MAQTVDWSRVTIGVSVGLHAGPGLWAVAGQTILSSNVPPNGLPSATYPSDLFQLTRNIRTGFTLAAQATHFSSPRFGLTFELTYLGLAVSDGCLVVRDGGDAELATACSYVGSDQKFGQGNNPTTGYHDASGSDQSASTTLVQAGVVVRPFKPATVQPFVKGLIGFAETPKSTVALESVYGAIADTALILTIYQDYGWKQTRPVFTAAAGFNTAPNSGLQVEFEVRETFLTQSIVTGPSLTQGLQPPYHSVLKGIPSVLVGLEIVLKRERGKRY